MMTRQQQQQEDAASNEDPDCSPHHLQRHRASLLSRSDFIRSTVAIAGVTAMVASSAVATASPSSSSPEEAEEASRASGLGLEGTVGAHSHDASAAHAATLGEYLLNNTSASCGEVSE